MRHMLMLCLFLNLWIVVVGLLSFWQAVLRPLAVLAQSRISIESAEA